MKALTSPLGPARLLLAVHFLPIPPRHLPCLPYLYPPTYLNFQITFQLHNLRSVPPGFHMEIEVAHQRCVPSRKGGCATLSDMHGKMSV